MKVTTCSFQHGLKLIYSFVFLSSKIVFFDRCLHLTQSTCTGVILLWVSIVFKLRIHQSRKGRYIVVDPDPNSSLYTKKKLAKQNDTAGKNYVLPTCSSIGNPGSLCVTRDITQVNYREHMKRSLGLKICWKMEIKIVETYHGASFCCP